MTATTLIAISYLIVAILFIVGLRAMSSPVTARRGIIQAGIGMGIAVIATFFLPGMGNYLLIILALLAGGLISGIAGGKIAMTAMPQGVAAFNGLGGGSAAAIAAVELINMYGHSETPGIPAAFSVLAALIGCMSLSGSAIAFIKLQGGLRKPIRLPLQNNIFILLSALAIVLGIATAFFSYPGLLVPFLVASLVIGIIGTLPIGGADMPVVISLLNALTGLAVGLEGYAVSNAAMVVAGVVVGASGMLLTTLMAKAMNRKLSGVLFKKFAIQGSSGGPDPNEGMKAVTALDVASMLRYASLVIIAPGYGMAVAGAQHKVWELTKALTALGVTVKFAIHPVAGRMPGHMNVLLAEAGVPYEMIHDMEEINSEFERCDVAVVIGANDVVNPAAREDKTSPIYGMPILNVDKAKSVIVNKRGHGAGYSGAPNSLFSAENTRLLFGSAQNAIAEVITSLRTLS